MQLGDPVTYNGYSPDDSVFYGDAVDETVEMWKTEGRKGWPFRRQRSRIPHKRTGCASWVGGTPPNVLTRGPVSIMLEHKSPGFCPTWWHVPT
jgi:hypothetical protein